MNIRSPFSVLDIRPAAGQTCRIGREAATVAPVDQVLLRGADRTLGPSDLAERFGDRIAVVIPAFNEGTNLGELLPRMPDSIDGTATSLLVVDDGSADDTAAVALSAGAVVATLARNAGGGAALRIGFDLMVRAKARVVVTMDADGQHRPEELGRVAEAVLDNRADLVQGSRVLGSAEPGPFARELGIAVFNRLVRVLTGVPVTDCSNGFRAIRTRMLPELDLRQAQFHTAEFLIETVTRGFTLQEVPVSVLSRRHGSSKKPAALRYGLGFSLAIVRAWGRSLRRDAAGRFPSRRRAVERLEGAGSPVKVAATAEGSPPLDQQDPSAALGKAAGSSSS
jgi:glycosyltransferase involved in cell wall biosynthesis